MYKVLLIFTVFTFGIQLPWGLPCGHPNFFSVTPFPTSHVLVWEGDPSVCFCWVVCFDRIGDLFVCFEPKPCEHEIHKLFKGTVIIDQWQKKGHAKIKDEKNYGAELE